MKAWWENLSQREKITVAGGSIILALILVYLFIYAPLINSVNNAQQQVAHNRTLLLRAQKIDAQIKSLPISSVATTFGLNELHETTKQFNLESSLKKIQQTPPNQFLVDFNNADFDVIINWLVQLSQQYNIHATKLTIISVMNEPGLVNARILLTTR